MINVHMHCDTKILVCKAVATQHSITEVFFALNFDQVVNLTLELLV